MSHRTRTARMEAGGPDPPYAASCRWP